MPEDETRRTRRKYWPFIERSTPILVDLSPLFAMPMTSRRERPTLGTAAYGITGTHQTPALLVRWVRTSTGAWLGLCDIELTSANGEAKLRVRQLVPARFITQTQDREQHLR